MGFLSWLFGASKESKPTVMQSDTKRYSVDIVGESHYQGALSAICGGPTEEGYKKIVEATLILEDSNPHDDKAVRVEIEGMTVGHLNRENARAYRRRLETVGQGGFKANCSAMIVGGWDRGGKDKGNFGLKLDIPVLEQRQVEREVTTNDPTITTITNNFSFSIEQVNIKELAHVRIGDLVNLWASGDAPTRIVIYPSGGLQLAHLPSIEECVSDINGVVLVISSVDGIKSFEKSDDVAIKIRLLRLARTFKSIRIAVTSKSDRQIYVGTARKSEYKVQVVPIES